MLKATVSGSFHRHMSAIYTAVGELHALGVNVLSPADPRIVDHLGEFLFVASDKLRSVKLVQDRHFEAIRASDFLWIVCPDGYTGNSVSAEIGAAVVVGTPVLSERRPTDITLAQYVQCVPSFQHAVENAAARHRERAQCSVDHFLLEPENTIERSIKAIERLKPLLTTNDVNPHQAEQEVKSARAFLNRAFGLARSM